MISSLLYTEQKKWKSCFCFFTDRKQHKVHDHDMITRDLECSWHDYCIICSYDVTGTDFENSLYDVVSILLAKTLLSLGPLNWLQVSCWLTSAAIWSLLVSHSLILLFWVTLPSLPTPPKSGPSLSPFSLLFRKMPKMIHCLLVFCVKMFGKGRQGIIFCKDNSIFLRQLRSKITDQLKGLFFQILSKY